MGSSIKISKRQSSRLASATVCFISFKRASATRSGFDRLQLLTIHSFMNHECMDSCGLFSHLRRSSSAIVTEISATLPLSGWAYLLSLTCPRARLGWAMAWWSNWGPRPILMFHHTVFQTVHSVEKHLVVLSRSVSQRRETCQTVV